jgi:hypothetical protein
MDDFIDSEVVDMDIRLMVPLIYLTSILVSLSLMVKPLVKNTLRIRLMSLKSPNGSMKVNLFAIESK